MNFQTVTAESIAIFFAAMYPNVFNILFSLVGTFYFLNMIKINVIDTRYDGSWKKYWSRFWQDIFGKQK